MIDVSASHLRIIRVILRKYIPGYEVRVFGSRLGGAAKRYSDLDLAAVGRKKLPKKILYSMREAFEESDLSFRVDILDWRSLSTDFKKIIAARYEVIQKAAAKIGPLGSKRPCDF